MSLSIILGAIWLFLGFYIIGYLCGLPILLVCLALRSVRKKKLLRGFKLPVVSLDMCRVSIGCAILFLVLGLTWFH